MVTLKTITFSTHMKRHTQSFCLKRKKNFCASGCSQQKHRDGGGAKIYFYFVNFCIM